jgi:indolepyruvate ferredoxin oxidoreductase
VAGGPFGRRDPATGRLVKREVGPWLMGAFRLMAPLRRLRGGVLDPFRGSAERRLAGELLARYEGDVERIVAGLSADNHAAAARLASWPDKVRGYGPCASSTRRRWRRSATRCSRRSRAGRRR